MHADMTRALLTIFKEKYLNSQEKLIEMKFSTVNIIHCNAAHKTFRIQCHEIV